MSNCWRAGLLREVLPERDLDKTGDTQFMDFIIELPFSLVISVN